MQTNFAHPFNSIRPFDGTCKARVHVGTIKSNKSPHKAEASARGPRIKSMHDRSDGVDVTVIFIKLQVSLEIILDHLHLVGWGQTRIK